MKKISWINNLSQSDKKTIKISFIINIFLMIICLGLSFIIKSWSYSYFFSILIGYLSSLFNYVKLVTVVTNVTNGSYQNAKKAYVINNLTSLILYFVVLLICTIVHLFNIFLCFLGIIIIKVVLIFQYTIFDKTKKISKEE